MTKPFSAARHAVFARHANLGSFRYLFFALLVCAAFHSIGQTNRPENDAFSSPTVDTCRWFDWSRSLGRVTQSKGLQLQTSSAATFSEGRVISQYMIKGDVVMEVSVAAGSGFEIPIPASAQMYASLGLWVDGGNFLLVSVAKSDAQNAIRVLKATNVNGVRRFQNFPDIPIASSSAKLRITQLSGQATLEYNVGGSWLTAATVSGFPDGAYVILSATTVGVQRQFLATFSEFSISNGNTSFRQYFRGEHIRRDDFMMGAVVTDYINLRIWGNKWQTSDPLQILSSNGVKWIRTGVTTQSVAALRNTPATQWGSLPWKNTYWSSHEVAGQVLKEASTKGLRLNLFLFLSDKAAHAGVQNAPPDWQGMSVSDTATKLEQYTRSVVSAYKAEGLSIDLYDVGNEIGFGVLDFRPGDRIPVPAGVDITSDMGFLRTSVWATEAELLKAAIAGIRAADPTAKIVLHVAGLSISPADILVKSFFKAMVDFGVLFDFAGLSHPYPAQQWRLNEYSTDCWFQRIQETSDYIATLGKKTIISEGAYPHSPTGMVASPMAEFPFTKEGQAGWLRELLRFANNNPNIAGFHYFYPEWYPGMSASNTTDGYEGLFDSNELPLPAMKEFGNDVGARLKPLSGTH